MDVGGWLRRLGLEQYQAAFRENKIDDAVLPSLTAEDLKDLGIGFVGHRRKLLDAIAALRAEASAPTPLSDAALEAHEPAKDTAERRQLTVMFCDLVGSTALSSRLDPEDMREVILAYQGACSGVMPTYDGFIAKFMGDGVLAYFGYPGAHEDDAERAVRAGLDIIEAVGRIKTRSGARLEVRIGIATGLVVVGDLIGEGTSQEQAVVGDTPNLAARLQGLAGPGTVVVAASTRRLLGDLFKLRDLGPHEVKGLFDPVNAWAVEGLSAAESRFEAVRATRMTGFVGRNHEIGLLLDCKRLAWQGEGQIVLVSGEAGIGKSRIAAAVSERLAAEPHTRLRYQCSPYRTNSALYPFIAHLERVAEIKADDQPEQKLDKLEAVLAMGASRVQAIAPIFAALLSIPFEGRYPPLTLSPAQQRRQTLVALLDQLEELARHESILLLFEDVHWADATSLELLDLMVDRLGHLPVLAIFTFRPGFEPAWAGLHNVTTLALGRLEQPQVQAMVEQVTGGRALPAEVMKEIINKTDGIPLFVEELTKTVLEAGILVEDAEGYRLDGPLPPLAIPATLQDSLMARLDRLAQIKEIAQIGGAIGREFPYTLLKTVVGRDEAALRSGLAQLEEAELVFRRGGPPEAVYKFKHALVQDAAYESLLKSRRQVLHRRIAEALRDHFPAIAETEPEVVAHHFTEARLLEAAIEWWGKAGEQALRRSAYIETVAHCAKAVSLANGLADGPTQRLLRVRLQIAHGNALMLARGLGAAETAAAFARAQEIAAGIEDVPERFSALRGLWNGSFDRGEMAPMRELAAAMMREAESLAGLPELCTAHRLCAITCQVEGNFDGAREHLERAIAAYDGKHSRTPALDFWGHQDVASMAHLAWVLWPLGEIDRARRLAEEAIVLAQRGGHVPTLAYAHGVTSNLEVMRRDARRVMTHGRAVVDLTREHGLPYWLAHGTIQVGWALWHSGDREAGEVGMREGMVLLRERAAQVFPFPYRILQAEVEAEVGRVEAGLAILDSQLVAIERSGQHMFDAEVHRVRGELLLRLEPADVAGAEAAFARAVEIARLQHTKTFELRTATSLARLWREGKCTEAQDLLAPIYGWFTEGFDTLDLKQAKALLDELA